MKNNKGFSLVELIVVVAIMAVLIGILAPAYLSYVEKTRKGTDVNTGEEVRAAVEKALAGELDVYDEIIDAMGTGSSLDLTVADGDAITDLADSYTYLEAALEEAFGSKDFDLKSKAYNGASLKVTITTSGSNTMEVTAVLTGGTLETDVTIK